MVAKELQKNEDSNRKGQKFANGHKYKELKFENILLSIEI